jgi:hypothetical protein
VPLARTVLFRAPFHSALNGAREHTIPLNTKGRERATEKNIYINVSHTSDIKDMFQFNFQENLWKIYGNDSTENNSDYSCINCDG